MQFHRARRRLVDGWSDVEANQIWEQAKQIIIHMIQLGKTSEDPILKIIGGITFDPETDYFGPFVGFTGHNYLYGFNGKEIVAEWFEMLRNVKHPKHVAALASNDDIVSWAMKNGGLDVDSLTDGLIESFGPLAPLRLAAMRTVTLNPGIRVAMIANSLFSQAIFTEQGSNGAYWQVPVAVLAELVVSGWKKTAWTWGVGIGLTEAVSAAMANDSGVRTLSGVSIITYGVFGHFFMELYKRPKLLKIMNLFKYPEFITLGIAGFGAWQAGYTMWLDPGWPVGGKAGIGHAFHHMGILYGAWLNR